MQINEINKETIEGKMLIAAISMLATQFLPDKSINYIISQLEEVCKPVIKDKVVSVDAEIYSKLNTTKRLEVGAKAKVIRAPHQHPVKEGDHVELYEYKHNGWFCKSGFDILRYWFHESDLELI